MRNFLRTAVMGLRGVMPELGRRFDIVALVAVVFTAAMSPAGAVTISYSSPTVSSGTQPPVLIGSDASAGSIDLQPGVAQDAKVWDWFLFINPLSTFSDQPYNLELTLNGITRTIPFLASATAGSGQYSFASNGTVSYALPGIGTVLVTGVGVATRIADPANAGPTFAIFYLEPISAAVPLPGAILLLGSGVFALGLMRRRRGA